MEQSKKILPILLVAIIFAVGGYFIGKGTISGQEAAFYKSATVAQKASWNCIRNPQGPGCDKAMTQTPSGTPVSGMMNINKTILAPGFYYRSTNGGQGCIITSESTEKSFTIDLPCPWIIQHLTTTIIK